MRPLDFGALVLLAALFAGGPASRAGTPLIADLSDDLVAITTGFEGSDLLLFEIGRASCRERV